MTECLLLRHAEPLMAGRFIGRGSDPPLSSGGRLCAEKIAPFLAAEEPDLVCVSPLLRARQTLHPAESVIKTKSIIVPELAEIDFGDWEGLSWEDIGRCWPELQKLWTADPWNTAPPGGETFAALQDRVMTKLESLVKLNPEKKILIVTHGGVIRSLLSYAFGRQNVSARTDYAGLCRFCCWEPGSWELVQWNQNI